MRSHDAIARRNFLRFALLASAALLSCGANGSHGLPDIRTVAPDLTLPPVTRGRPAAGKRVVQTEFAYAGTSVHHILYLPQDWEPGKRFPVIVEYAGNGPYENEYGDVSTGEVEGSKMGYGLTAGKGFIWLALPFVNSSEKRNQALWWGDPEATADYAKQAVRGVCEQYGGDPAAVILAGFSRGAIACNFIGLHDDAIADIWLAFMPYSHYDGVRRWRYAGSDGRAARIRLERLKGRASFITHERSIAETRNYIERTGIAAPFTFQAIPYRNHNDGWTLRGIAVRRAARQWLRTVLRERPGAHAVRGRVTGPSGMPLPRVRIASGAHHWTTTAADGSYELAGLIDSKRAIEAYADGIEFQPRSHKVVIAGQDLENVNFTAL